jgi:hypothetical protein
MIKKMSPDELVKFLVEKVAPVVTLLESSEHEDDAVFIACLAIGITMTRNCESHEDVKYALGAAQLFDQAMLDMVNGDGTSDIVYADKEPTKDN